MNTKDIFIYIEVLRNEKELTIAELCLDVISCEAYRLVRKGDRDITLQKLIGLCSNLGINIDDFFSSYVSKHNYESKTIRDLLTRIQKRNYKDYYELYKSSKIENHIFIDYTNAIALEYCKHRYDFNNNTISLDTLNEFLLNQMSFFKLNKRKSYSLIELIILNAYINTNEKTSTDIEDSVKLLKDIIFDKECYFHGFNEENIVIPSCVLLTRYFGRKERFDEAFVVIQYCTNYSHDKKTTYDMESIFYLEFYIKLLQNEDDNSLLESIDSIYNTLKLNNNSERYYRYIEIIKKDFKKHDRSIDISAYEQFEWYK